MSKEIKSDDSIVMLAEWERQSAIQLTWPHKDTDWQPILDKITSTYIELVRAISAYEKIIIIAPDIKDVKNCISQAIPDINHNHIDYLQCETDDTWARDHGFISLRSDKDTYYVDFKFNGWGDKFPAAKDNVINKALYHTGMLKGTYIDHLDFVLEGGSIESDGKGTVFTTTGCLMAPNRNQPLYKDELEERLKTYLCAKRVQWIDHGNLIGDDTDGHIDTLVRIAPDDTLIYVSCDDKTDPHYEGLKKMEHDLQQLRTAEGNKYTLVALPLPDAIYEDGERLPATYANYLIINGAVIVPTYAQKEKDKKAMKIIGTIFKDRKIIGVDSRSIIRQHGSIHCCTMQYY